jgi:fructose-specific component phosphotransferase system IIB-like protein
MNKIISFLVFSTLLLFANSCNKTNSDQSNKEATYVSYLSVDETFAKGDTLADKSIQVKGIIEHVCKHTWKRFKIVDKAGEHELKIELGDRFPSVDASILGKKVKVTGKLIPVRMDEKMVLQWEEKVKENHKGEEDTKHYKEEIVYIQNIYKQITTGEISYYTMYSVEAESYELE